jgi:hypothetical protein
MFAIVEDCWEKASWWERGSLKLERRREFKITLTPNRRVEQTTRREKNE